MNYDGLEKDHDSPTAGKCLCGNKQFYFIHSDGPQFRALMCRHCLKFWDVVGGASNTDTIVAIPSNQTFSSFEISNAYGSTPFFIAKTIFPRSLLDEVLSWPQ